ncbi:MAG: hydrogenase, partial [Desulfuromonadaceae bacterium]
MISLADQLLVLVLLINFISLGTSRLIFSIRAVAVQGVILGILPGLIHPFSWHLVGITVVIIAIKGFVIPLLLVRAVHSAEIKREVEPFLGYVPTLLLGAVFTALSFGFAGRLPMLPEHQNYMFVPASIATLMAGFLILTTRRKAISQVIG